jgi:hypothetical protein
MLIDLQTKLRDANDMGQIEGLSMLDDKVERRLGEVVELPDAVQRRPSIVDRRGLDFLEH